jgi:hypothetical protein
MPSLRRSPQMISASVSFGATVTRATSSTRLSLRRSRLSSVRSRAHSSAGERPLHTREVPGSIPGAPMALQAVSHLIGRSQKLHWQVDWQVQKATRLRATI